MFQFSLTSSQKRWATWSLCGLLLILSYPAYLLMGGDFAREPLKALIAARRLQTTYKISSGSNGGDCGRLGRWMPKERRCELNRDLLGGESIQVSSDGITLDGMGHRMQGAGQPFAVALINVSRTSVRNFVIDGYQTGIYLQHSTRNQLTGLTVRSGVGHGVHLTGHSNLNHIVGNNLSDFKLHGIALWSSHGNIISSNSISRVRDGVRLQSSDGNVITWNAITDTEVEGIDLHISSANTIYLNSVEGSTPIPILDDIGANWYSLGSIGNYFSRFDSSNSGCPDSSGDGRCDKPYRFAFGADTGALSAPPFSHDAFRRAAARVR